MHLIRRTVQELHHVAQAFEIQTLILPTGEVIEEKQLKTTTVFIAVRILLARGNNCRSSSLIRCDALAEYGQFLRI